MPSPFPGMDPYLEVDEWQEYHVNFIVEIQRQLMPLLRPRYRARIERRVYLERETSQAQQFQPDVQIQRRRSPSKARSTQAVVATIEPKVYQLPMPEEHREPFLTIRDYKANEVVTVIELLSPTNKRPGSDGFREYHKKRDKLLKMQVQLVEIDLLRGGSRLRTVSPLAESTDYCAYVHRHGEFPDVEVYEWGLRDPLPTIPVPLAEPDGDVPLNLQAAFTHFYDDGFYGDIVDYDVPLAPPLRRADVTWAKRILAKRNAR